MKLKVRTYLARIKAQTTPEQLVWVSRAMFFIGCGWLWRAAHSTNPSTVLSMVGLGVFTAGAICYVNVLIRTPRLQGVTRWSVPIFAGAFLNYAVIIANGGYMPAANQDVMAGMYCPIAGANLPWLADWIGSFVSPGDVLMVIGAAGIAATLARRRQRRLAEQAL